MEIVPRIESSDLVGNPMKTRPTGLKSPELPAFLVLTVCPRTTDCTSKSRALRSLMQGPEAVKISDLLWRGQIEASGLEQSEKYPAIAFSID